MLEVLDGRNLRRGLLIHVNVLLHAVNERALPELSTAIRLLYQTFIGSSHLIVGRAHKRLDHGVKVDVGVRE